MLPNEGGKQIFKNNDKTVEESGKENTKLQTKFIKWQVLCIPSFLQKGLGGESSKGVELQAVFEGGQEANT